MTGQPLLCHGKPLRLGECIGRGGEGVVHMLADDSERAVKLYLKPDADGEAKIKAIVGANLGTSCPNVAFPLELVQYAGGAFAGFTMQRVTGHEPIHELISTGSRRRYFPQADWRFLVRVALNVARIVATVHAAGVIIGDINSAGFLVSQQALVTLIDADSFQVGDHHCRVGMAEYTPPELQGMHFGSVQRTVDHDAFGLAVILFQILALGRHPFTGIARGRPVPIESAIQQGRFAYSQIRNTGTEAPEAALKLHDLPQGVQLLFERAFALRMEPRPTAAEWVKEMATLEAKLTPCPARPHHFVASLATPCAWCRIEENTGRAIFQDGIPTKPRRVVPARTELHHDVARATGYARTYAGETIEPSWPAPAITPSKAARKLATEREASNAPHEIFKILALSDTRTAPFIDEYEAANRSAVKLLEGWRNDIGVWKVLNGVSALNDSLAAFDRTRSHMPSLIAQGGPHITTLQAMGIMRAKSIVDARIAGIGDGVRTLLAQHGIFNAAQLDRTRLAAVPGLGETRMVALLFWRAGIAAEAERESAHSRDHETNHEGAARDRVGQHLGQLERMVREQIDKLYEQVAAVQRRSLVIDRSVQAALMKRDQAGTDLAYLGIDRTAGIEPATLRAGSISPKKKVKPKASASKGKPSCLKCGSPMVKRWARAAANARIWGCTRYPVCTGTRPYAKKRKRRRKVALTRPVRLSGVSAAPIFSRALPALPRSRGYRAGRWDHSRRRGYRALLHDIHAGGRRALRAFRHSPMARHCPPAGACLLHRG